MSTPEVWTIRHGSFRGTGSSGGALVFYDIDGTSQTLASTERYAVYDVTVSMTVAGQAVVMSTSNATIAQKDAMFRGNVLASSPQTVHFTRPVICRKGIPIRVLCTSGNTVNCQVHAEVRPG